MVLEMDNTKSPESVFVHTIRDMREAGRYVALQRFIRETYARKFECEPDINLSLCFCVRRIYHALSLSHGFIRKNTMAFMNAESPRDLPTHIDTRDFPMYDRAVYHWPPEEVYKNSRTTEKKRNQKTKKEVQKMGTTGAKKERQLVCGIAPTAAVRVLAEQGVSKEDTRACLEAHGIELADATYNIQRSRALTGTVPAPAVEKSVIAELMAPLGATKPKPKAKPKAKATAKAEPKPKAKPKAKATAKGKAWASEESE